jgi:hypothetical protein
MEQWNNGTMEQWNNGTMEQWNNGTMEQWNNGTNNSGTMGQWDNGTMGHRDIGHWTFNNGLDIAELFFFREDDHKYQILFYLFLANFLVLYHLTWKSLFYRLFYDVILSDPENVCNRANKSYLELENMHSAGWSATQRLMEVIQPPKKVIIHSR